MGVLALVVVGLLVALVVRLIRGLGSRDVGDMVVVQRQPVPAATPNPAPAAKVPPVRSTPAPAPLPRRPRPSPERRPPARAAGVTPLPRRPAPVSPADGSEWVIAGDVRLSPARGEVWCGDRRVELSPAELGILELLMTSGGRGVTREAIIEAGQLDDSDGPDAVDAMVAQVRRKTGARGRGNVVRKERVVMYFLEGIEPDPEG
jgi:hypothetical protein